MKLKTNKITILLSTLALILSFTALASIYLLSTRLEDAKKESFIHDTLSGYNMSKLEFCVNHAIRPCEDPSITTWNQANQTEQFSLQTFQQLVEQGIGDYNTSHK